MVQFATLAGDYSRMHLDRHFALETNRGNRVAHGLLGASHSLGALSHDAPATLGRSLPGWCLQGYSVNYRQVVLVNDTLRTAWETGAEMRQEDGSTAVETGFRLYNQGNVAVADGQLHVVRGDPGQPAPAPWEVTPEPVPQQPLYLEDYREGAQSGRTEGRTLGEADVLGFAGLTGDYNPLYVDAEYAASGPFGQRIVPPMLLFNLLFAAWLRQWMRQPMPDAGFAGHIADRWRFVAPCFPGDTLHCRYRTLAVRPSASRPQVGILTIGLQGVNQRDEVVLQGETLMMYPARP